MNIITGEKFQNLCDYFIGNSSDFKYNPKIEIQSPKHININNYDVVLINTLQISNIFCYTHILLSEMNDLIRIMSSISCRFNIIFHNSDAAFKNQFKALLEIPNLNKIFTQNISIPISPRIVPIPIGIANSMWTHGNLNVWENQLKNGCTHKSNYIYFNFTVTTNRKKRQHCFDVISSQNIPNLPHTNYPIYLQTLSTYKFGICPEGNGNDTHRFWECLYLKVIPICLKNYLTEYYSKIFPVMLLTDWCDIDHRNLEDFYRNANWENYRTLDFITHIHNIGMENNSCVHS